MTSHPSFSPDAKVWIYQSSRPFNAEEVAELNLLLADFAGKWTAHNQQLQATAYLLEERIIVLMVDETHTLASGCSIDTSVHFIQSLEAKFHVTLFDRMLINYKTNGAVHTTTLSALEALAAEGKINAATLIYNPLVHSKFELDTVFLVPLSESWVAGFIHQ